MERGRTRVSRTRKESEKVDKSEDGQTSNLGCSISDIPRYIWFEILLLLSVKGLLICRCACKLWRDIISEAEFAKHYFAKSEVHTLIRPLFSTHVSGILYLVEHPPFSTYVDHFMTKLDTKLYIPLRPDDHRLRIVNSCRGLLCLFDSIKNEPGVVCNPITGEYIDLPTATHGDDCKEIPANCALGFSPQDNQYKVIRMFDDRVHQWRNDPITGKSRWTRSVAEIHTLGSSSWRMIGDAPSPHYKLEYATYLNGAIHWLYSDNRRPNYIVSFNFVNEKFQPISPPHYDYDMFDLAWSPYITLGELRGCLCMCVPSTYEIAVLVMKDYGVGESWTEEFRLTTSAFFRIWIKDSYKPIYNSSNGCFLLLQPLSNSIYCFEPNGEHFKFLRLLGLKSEYEVITYTPNFISLKDVVAGEDIEVLNIKSRFAGLKLPGETETLSLEQQLPIQTSLPPHIYHDDDDDSDTD